MGVGEEESLGGGIPRGEVGEGAQRRIRRNENSFLLYLLSNCIRGINRSTEGWSEGVAAGRHGKEVEGR